MALQRNVVSKTFIPEKGHKAFTALLLGIASYKLYKFCKSKLAKSESISSYDEEQTTKFTEKIECECLEIDLVREKVKEE